MARKTRTRTRTVVVRRSGSRKRKGFTLPLAVVGGLAPLAIVGVQSYKAGGLPNLLEQTALYTTGYHYSTKTWNPSYMIRGLGPIVLGVLAHKLAGRLGINRALAGAGIPFLRI